MKTLGLLSQLREVDTCENNNANYDGSNDAT
jgi:hypothetical protein